MKKIGIFTFHRTNNYGAVLQNYALQKGLRNIFCDDKVETINYVNDYLEAPYKIPPFSDKNSNFIKVIIYKIRYLLFINKFHRLCTEFEKFRNDNLFVSKEYFKNNIMNGFYDYDIYITGSDQVWNDVITGGDEVYSLGFKTDGIKVSYAASAGSINTIGENTKSNILEINYISVRETELQQYLVEKTDKQIYTVVDPVFLLKKDEWDILLNDNKHKKPFIFTYSVSEMTDDVVKLAKSISKKTGYEIYHIDHSIKYGINGRCVYGASPSEFTEYIRDAEIVIASSFHAVAFSIIYGKKFIVIPTKKTASRLIELLRLVDAEDNMYDSYDDYLKNSKPIKIADACKLNERILDSIEFLKQVI